MTWCAPGKRTSAEEEKDSFDRLDPLDEVFFLSIGDSSMRDSALLFGSLLKSVLFRLVFEGNEPHAKAKGTEFRSRCNG